MASRSQDRNRLQDRSSSSRLDYNGLSAVSALLITLAMLLTQSVGVAEAQGFSILHAFDKWRAPETTGIEPVAGLTQDQFGNLYGTTLIGGRVGGNCGTYPNTGCGTVFKLIRAGSGWALRTIFAFRGGVDGGFPLAGVIFGRDGSLYGTTGIQPFQEATVVDWGSVFKLTPPEMPCNDDDVCFWTKTILHSFPAGDRSHDGWAPGSGDLVFDAAGNLYGTTLYGGYRGGRCGLLGGCGVVYELTSSNGVWTEKILYQFTASKDGFRPNSGVILDAEGNLYGTAAEGGVYGYGTVYQLTPTPLGYVETSLHSFDLEDGAYPGGGLVFDQAGDLYGTTSSGGSGWGGTVFELIPSDGGWNFSTVYNFQGVYGPFANLSIDGAANLYGTTTSDGLYGDGNVFKLAPGNRRWMYTDLHDFMFTDGESPQGTLVLDHNGNIYSTTPLGGLFPCDCGVVWEITP